MPKTEVWPDDWRIDKLGKAAGLIARRPKPFIGSLPYIATADVEDGRAAPSEDVTFDNMPARAGIQLANDDVLQAKMSGTNKALIVSHKLEGWVASTGFAQFAPKSVGASPRYFFHWLQSEEFYHKKEALCVGSTQRAISQSDLAALPLRVPSKTTQDLIVKILNSIEEEIKQTKALVDKYEQIKKGLLHDLFTRGVQPDGSLRASSVGSQKTKFGWIPKAWSIGSLLDVASSSRQPILTGPFGADLGNDDFICEGIPVLRIGNVQQGRLDLTNLLYVSEVKAKQLERYKISEGDLLFARQGATTGRNALAEKSSHGYLINYHIIRVALDHLKCSPLFIEAAFAGEIVKRQITRDKGRGTREGINTAQLKALELPLASLDEQRAIAKILMAHTVLCMATQKKLEKLRKEKLGLMSDLLTGRVSVKVFEKIIA